MLDSTAWQKFDPLGEEKKYDLNKNSISLRSAENFWALTKSLNEI
jgi:hypothetical protein